MAANPRNRRSREWVETALLQLMVDRPFQAITITDIAEKAGVSRLTFYRNYASKEEVLLEHFDRLFEAYLATVEDTEGISLEKALVLCFTYWQSHADESRLLIRDGLSSLLYGPYGRYLDRVLECIAEAVPLTRTQKQFVVGGLFFVLMDWLEDDARRSAEAMAQEVLGLVPYG